MEKREDNSDRAFYKELGKVIEASDVILEVLDARDPLGTRCADMEKMVMRLGPDKHLVLLLNKIDLVPREAVEKWLKYLREELPAVAFKCSTQEQRSNLGWKSSSKAAKAKPSNLLQTSDCLGAETLIKLLKNYSRSHEIKKSITVGVIGLPNVGKSSLINSLKRCHVVNVGATPGLTRSMQEVQLDKNVKLLDCPGVVMLRSGESDASIALRNCKRIEKLDDPIDPVKEILKLCSARMLITLYKLPSFDSVDDFLQKVATVRGKLKKGGIVDVEAAARIVLRDWNEGKIPYYTMPPTRDQGQSLEATIVSELGKEFNVEEVYNGESSFIGSLKSVDDFHHVEVPPSDPLNFDEKMLEVCDISYLFLKKFGVWDLSDNNKQLIGGDMGGLSSFGTISCELYKPTGRDMKRRLRPRPPSFHYSYLSDTKRIHKQYKYGKKNQDDNHGGVNVHDGDPSEDWMIPAKSDPPEDSEEFKQLVHKAFFKFSKQLNDNPSHGRIYKEQGKNGHLICSVCDSLFAPQDDVQPQASTQDDEQPKETTEEGDSQPMASDEKDAGKTKAKTANSRQNEKLYSAEGILNTRIQKAEKKKRRKANKSSSRDAMDADYDFKVDYAKKESTMDTSDESGDDEDDNQISGEVPMSGIELD
ncbi:hypothetical protein HHK36_013021 [Tetracentron sinense]|uniref:CP-type G domain-containing protein n=1 Tax=Tetracentron sinense TaxID=13715 RepID=A0A834Z5R4_TETSI|nr:hypothetical protein HHK36_013021 [Tetracentron sinense]